MQLHDLRSNPIIKLFAYLGFGLIIISFVFFYGWGQAAPSGGGDINPTMARYKSDDPMNFLPWREWEEIKGSEVRDAMDIVNNKKLGFVPQQLLQFLMQQSGNLPQWANEAEGIQYAMDERILGAEARRLGINVPAQDVLDQLRTQYASNYQAIDAMLDREGKTMEQFVTELQRQQEALQAREFIKRRARVSLYELWQEYAMVNEKITLELAAFPAEHYSDKVQVTDGELQAHLDSHQDDFKVPAKRRYGYVLVTSEDIQAKLQPTREDLQKYFDENKTQFEKADSVRVEEIFAPVSTDQPTTGALALIAKAHDASTTTGLWGDLARSIESANPGSTLYYRADQWIENNEEYRSLYGAEYVDRVFALANDQISTPVQSATGMHVVRKLEKREKGTPEFDAVYADVEKRYKEAKGAEEFRATFDKMREEVRKYPSVQDFAKATGYEDKLTTAVAATDLFIPEIGSVAEHRSYINQLKKDQLSELIPMPASSPTSFAAIQIVEETEAYIPKLDEVRVEIEKAVRLVKAADEARVAAQLLRDKVVAGSPLAEAAVGGPKEVVTTDPFTRMESVETLGAPLIDFQKETLRIAEGSSGISPYGASKDNVTGYAVWRVTKIEQPSKQDFARDRVTFEAQYIAVLGEALVEEWLADKRKEMGYELLFKPNS